MDFDFLSKTVLFKGCTDEEIKHMLICLKNKPELFMIIHFTAVNAA